jgi:seryl-tRNA synthetase
MLDVNFIRKNPDKVREGLRAKHVEVGLLDRFFELDEKWRKMTEEADDLRAQLNKFSKERNIEEAKKVKELVKKAEEGIVGVEKEREALLFNLPNLPEDGWLFGHGEEDNKVVREVGEKPKFDFEPLDYLAIAEKLGIIDVARGGKVAGSRFGYLLGAGALLEFALVHFALNRLAKKGFIPVVPPVMIKPDVYRGMGRLAGGQEEERYYLPKDDLYLVGSSEHTIGPMHMDEVFAEKDLPRRYVGFSTCFRREAGSYGKDTKGILRVHQFDKVELFAFTTPDKSREEHQFLLSTQEELMQELGLPYQVVQVCTGDMGFTDAAQYDIETWLPGQGKYRETQSCSNTTDFQARGINAKYKSAEGNKFVHMLNGTAFAIGRMIIAIIENGQTKEGDVLLPKALAPYLGFDRIVSSRNA